MFKHSRSDSSRIVRGILERMPASNKVLHSLRSPAADAQIDHVGVSPGGIFAIDVGRARGTVKVRRDTLWLGGNDLIDTCISAQRKAGEVGKFMRHAVTPVLCFVDAILPAPVIHLRHVVVCTPDILRDYINGGPRCLDRDPWSGSHSRGDAGLGQPGGARFSARAATVPGAFRSNGGGGQGHRHGCGARCHPEDLPDRGCR